MNFLFDTWQKLYDFWVDGWNWIFEQLLLAFVVVLEAIPVPSWASNISTMSVPSEMMYFINAFEIPYGAGVMASAWAIRFVIRRLPVIG